jgi:hypothetical protein
VRNTALASSVRLSVAPLFKFKSYGATHETVIVPWLSNYIKAGARLEARDKANDESCEKSITTLMEQLLPLLISCLLQRCNPEDTRRKTTEHSKSELNSVSEELHHDKRLHGVIFRRATSSSSYVVSPNGSSVNTVKTLWGNGFHYEIKQFGKPGIAL